MRNRALLALPLAVLAVGCEDSALGLEATLDEVSVSAVGVNAPAHWNEVARSLVAERGASPFVAARAYAMVSVAQYNGAVAAARNPRGNPNTLVRSAVTRASVDVLSHVFAGSGTELETKAEAFLAANRSRADRADDEAAGAALGAAAAAAVIQSRDGDGFSAPWNGTVPTGPGLWYSSAVPPAPPTQPLLGQAKPFILTSGDQFRPGAPPAFGSPEYLAALAEVRHYADTRTPRQDSIAKFWALPAGTYTPLGYWNEEAARLVLEHHLSDTRAAHLFALMNMVGADALIASHDAKYAYWLIRPSQADPGIQLAIGLPNFPAYGSNHSTLSAGMARIIGARFPSERSRLDRLAEEASMSRLYAGIHYRFDNETGLQLGRRIAAWALDHDVWQGHPFDLP